MSIRKSSPKKIWRGVLLLVPGLLLLACISLSQAAHAVVLQIDSTRSEVGYTTAHRFCYPDPQGAGFICPSETSQVFSIAGEINLSVIHEHFEFGFGYPDVDRDL